MGAFMPRCLVYSNSLKQILSGFFYQEGVDLLISEGENMWATWINWLFIFWATSQRKRAGESG